MELLAPAGSKESLIAAVQNGADAVYLAGQQFGARHSAKNFSDEELKDAVDYAHVYDVKIYVTVNTAVKDSEYAAVLGFIQYLYAIGVDAILVQDTALGAAVKRQLPHFRVHASTQMSIHDVSGALYLEKLAFDRVVLARELSYTEIQKIREQTTIELEVFAHGALCMCYSGQCYMSSFMGGRSGNRGRCAQPCRLAYEMWEGGRQIKAGHLLSPKDLSIVNHLKTIDPNAFHSLKIEGRLKSPLYVATVCHVFRDCLDHAAALSKKNEMLLRDAFCRTGFTDGYFVGKLGAHMMSYETPTNTAFYQKRDASIAKDQNELAQTFAEGAAPIRKLPVTVALNWQFDQPMVLTMTDERGFSVRVEGQKKIEKAQRAPMCFDRVKEQLEKTGSTPFFVTKVYGEFEEGLCLPVKEINAVRRLATDELLQKISQSFHRNSLPLLPAFPSQVRQKTTTKLTVQVTTKEQLFTALRHTFARIYVPENLWKEAHGLSERCVLKCPDILTEHLPNASSQLVGNVGYLEKNLPQNCYGDFRLGIFNEQAVHFYEQQKIASLTLSIELSTQEMARVIDRTSLPLEAVVYGKLPLMMMKNCPFRAVKGACPKDCSSLYLKDRRGEKLSHVCDGHRICTILNAKPLYIADIWHKCVPQNLAMARLWFTDESERVCEQVILEYEKAVEGKTAANIWPENAFTRGHFHKGVL